MKKLIINLLGMFLLIGTFSNANASTYYIGEIILGLHSNVEWTQYGLYENVRKDISIGAAETQIKRNSGEDYWMNGNLYQWEFLYIKGEAGNSTFDKDGFSAASFTITRNYYFNFDTPTDLNFYFDGHEYVELSGDEDHYMYENAHIGWSTDYKLIEIDGGERIVDQFSRGLEHGLYGQSYYFESLSFPYKQFEYNHLEGKYLVTLETQLYGQGQANYTSHGVPEPATVFLLGSGLIGLVGFRRKLRK